MTTTHVPRTPLGTRPVVARFDANDICYMYYAAMQSFLTDPTQKGRFQPTHDPIKWKPTRRDCFFWCDDYISAKIVRDFHRKNRRQAVLLVDAASCPAQWIVLVRNFSLGFGKPPQPSAKRRAPK